MSNPICLALIPDGNRTWAKKLNRPSLEGHSQGRKVADRIITTAFDANVTHVAFWSMSESNLTQRSPEEILHLYLLFKEELKLREGRGDDGVCLKVCGRWKEFHADPELEDLIERAHERTRANDGVKNLTILFGYSGTTDILHASRSLSASGEVQTEESFQRHLISAPVPKIDILIRTGNKRHFSEGFLNWQMRGSVYVHFSKAMWPDFTIAELFSVLRRYNEYTFNQGS